MKRELLMIAALTATGCGQRGPLVLPDRHPGAPVMQPGTMPGSAAPGSPGSAPATGMPTPMDAPPDSAPPAGPAPEKKKKPQ